MCHGGPSQPGPGRTWAFDSANFLAALAAAVVVSILRALAGEHPQDHRRLEEQRALPAAAACSSRSQARARASSDVAGREKTRFSDRHRPVSLTT